MEMLKTSPMFARYRNVAKEAMAGEESELDAVSVGMLGSHQATNAAVAIATLRRLQADGWDIPESAIRRGIATARVQARVEVLSHEPLTVLDTAHNLASIDALISAMDESFSRAPKKLYPPSCLSPPINSTT